MAVRIFVAIQKVFGNVRDLRPDNHAVLVTQVVEILVVLVMGQSDGIAAHLTHEVHILLMHFRCQCVSNAFAVLMPRRIDGRDGH